MRTDHDLLVFEQVVLRVAQDGGSDEHLVEGVGVHEDVVGAVVVEVLHVPLLDEGPLHLLAGPQRALEHGAGAHVLQLGAHEGMALAGLDVLEVHQREQSVVEVKRHPGLEVGSGDLGHGRTSAGRFGGAAAIERAAAGQG